MVFGKPVQRAVETGPSRRGHTWGAGGARSVRHARGAERIGLSAGEARCRPHVAPGSRAAGTSATTGMRASTKQRRGSGGSCAPALGLRLSQCKCTSSSGPCCSGSAAAGTTRQRRSQAVASGPHRTAPSTKQQSSRGTADTAANARRAPVGVAVHNDQAVAGSVDHVVKVLLGHLRRRG